MNKLSYRIIGNALSGFATGFVSVTVVTSAMTLEGIMVGCLAGFLQVCLSCGAEFKAAGETTNKKTKTPVLTVF